MTGMINQIESVRKQLQDIKTRLADKRKPLSEEAEGLDKKRLEVEAAFFDPHIGLKSLTTVAARPMIIAKRPVCVDGEWSGASSEMDRAAGSLRNEGSKSE
jgi:hypothetical protein